MGWVWLVVVAVVAHIMYVMMLVGSARGKYDVKAPATSGNEIFERHYRVHLNSVEQAVIFFPLLAACAYTGTPTIAAGLGLAYLLGRIHYGFSYVKDPAKRGTGMMVGFLAQVGLMLVALYNIVTGML